MNTIKIESHLEQKKRHEAEFSAFEGIFWACGKAQLEALLVRINAKREDILSLGAGGFLLKSKEKEFDELIDGQRAERAQRLKDAKALFEALVYELRNHEYGITYDLADALFALGLNEADIDPAVLKKACKEALKGTGE